jgi:hypothetical protein
MFALLVLLYFVVGFAISLVGIPWMFYAGTPRRKATLVQPAYVFVALLSGLYAVPTWQRLPKPVAIFAGWPSWVFH